MLIQNLSSLARVVNLRPNIESRASKINSPSFERSCSNNLLLRRNLLLSIATPFINLDVFTENEVAIGSETKWVQPNDNFPNKDGESGIPLFEARGPHKVGKVFPQEHTCSVCFPDCLASSCLLKINILYPKNHTSVQKNGFKLPLAIFTPGFLVSSSQYSTYLEHLASWGYVALSYDKVESIISPLDDLICARFISELIDWAGSNALLKDIIDTDGVYLLGHSRGAKVSVLAASEDPRIAALCLIDPVDNTAYAPLGPGFPSAVAALEAGKDTIERLLERKVPVNGMRKLSVPTAIIGGGVMGDCAPLGSNFREFFKAASAPSWEVVLQNASHFQFLDNPTFMQSSVCGLGEESEEVVKEVTNGVMAAWGSLFVPSASALVDFQDFITPSQDSELFERIALAFKNRISHDLNITSTLKTSY